MSRLHSKTFTPSGPRDVRGITPYAVEVHSKQSPGGTMATTYAHPSFGQVRVSRYTGGTKGRLFQSNCDLNTGISITISRAELTRDLSNDWLHSQEELVEIRLSPAQWADLLTNMNTQGVPCTISHFTEPTTGDFICPEYPEEFDNQLDRIEREFKAAIKGLETAKTEDLQDIKEVAAKLTKKDQDKLMRAIQSLDREVKSHIPFIRDMFEETTQRTLTQFKQEAANFVTQTLAQAGMQHLQSQAPTVPTLGFTKDEV